MFKKTSKEEPFVTIKSNLQSVLTSDTVTEVELFEPVNSIESAEPNIEAEIASPTESVFLLIIIVLLFCLIVT